jgi:hypothetical protein
MVFFLLFNAEEVRKTVEFNSTVMQKTLRDGKPYILDARCGRTQQHETIRDGAKQFPFSVKSYVSKTQAIGLHQANKSLIKIYYNLLSVIVFKTDDDRLFFVKQDPTHSVLKAIITNKTDET